MLDTGQLPLTGEALQRFRQGLAAAGAAEYEQAIFHFDWVLESRPDFYEVWYERGLALENCGDYTGAIASFDRALALRPRLDATCQIWNDRGNALQYGLGDYAAAIACYDRVLHLKTDHEQAWQNRGNALLYGLNAPEESLSCYDRVLQINPDNYLGWRNRGNALVELQRYPQAIASYERALALKPDDEISWQARNLAMETGGLSDRQPTTNPVWSSAGYSEVTSVEGDGNFPAPTTPFADTSLPLSPGMPHLVIDDDWGRRELPLGQPQYTIGRDPDCDICLHSRFASRRHAVLLRFDLPEGGFGYRIVDGDTGGNPSTNGLLVNGCRCQTWELQAGDAVVFGPRVQAIYRLAPSQLPDRP
jgi:tetratricopeptide (TPR) repeat protein